MNPTIVTKLRENIAGPGGLHFFDLSSGNVGPKEVSAIADCIKFNYQSCDGMAPLISIDLSGNQLCGLDFIMQGTYEPEGFGDFCTTLVNMSKISRLRKINLSRNFLDVKGFALISNLLINGPQSLQELGLRACGGDAQAIEKLSEGLKVNKNIVTLDLRQNHFGPGGAEFLSDFLATTSRLKQIYLSECDLGAEGTAVICKALCTNDSIEMLSLGDNNFGDAGSESVATMLRTNKKLRHLDLQENLIALEGISAIAKALAKNRTLVFLGVQWNDLSNEGAARLGEALLYNNTLKSMHLVGNHIDADGISLLIESSLACDNKPIDLDLGYAHQPATTKKRAESTPPVEAEEQS